MALFLVLTSSIAAGLILTFAGLWLMNLIFRATEWLWGQAVDRIAWIKRMLVVMGLLSGCGHPMPGPRLPDVDIYTQIATSTVVVETDTGVGSGTILFNDQKLLLVLTCAHVVDGKPKELDVITADGQKMPASVLKMDEETDLALLVSDSPGTPAPASMRLATREPRLFAQL